MNNEEKNFYLSFKRCTPGWFWERIENSVSSGVPDAICVPKAEKSRSLFLEFKSLPASNIQIRKSQYVWIVRFAAWCRDGGFVVNRDPDTKRVVFFSFDTIRSGICITGKKDHLKLKTKPDFELVRLPFIKPEMLLEPVVQPV